MKTQFNRLAFLSVALAGVLALSLSTSCVTQNAAPARVRTRLGTIPEFHPELGLGALQGYLDPQALPNSLALIPPPPAPGSTAYALDEEIAQNTFALRGTPRFALAASDFDLKRSNFVNDFSCALNVQITKENAPYLYTLLCRSFSDIGQSTYAAKNYYKRKRPFQENGAPLAVPEARDFLEKDPSYPSGHTALGWGFALILTEIAPDRTDEILARGRAFGESRIVCNHHWFSDVVWGRFMGAAAVARLHADPVFCADLEAAKTEYAALRAKAAPLTCDCAAEAAALALGFQAQSVTAIDILLEPDATMLAHAAENNARLLKVNPKGFSLDAANMPHITMLQCFVPVANLEKVYAAAGQVLAAANVTAMKLEAFTYYYAPAGADGVAGICAKPTPEIIKLQADIVAAVKPYLAETGPIGAFTAPHGDAATDAALIGYVATFADKLTGENFNPHVSTGVASKEYLDQMLAEPFVPFTFSPAGAAVYQLGPFGTAAKKLKELDLEP
jgi:acid phosphatase (class A)